MNDIAVIMCTWKRVQRLEKTINDFKKQNFKDFDIYFWNNNIVEKNVINRTIEKKSGLNIVVHHSLINEGGFGRFLYARKLKNKYKMFIFIDDDQNFDENFILKFKEVYKPKVMFSWYGWKLYDSYWNRIRAENNVECDYCGTGGMMTDSEIFKHELIYNIPEKYKFVEDLWLSYIAKNVYGWKLYGIDQNISIDIDNLDQSIKIKHLKNEFYNYLLNKKEFNLIKKQ